MEQQYVIKADNLTKSLGDFSLDIEELRIPQGFSTALIGENGAGKTTLLNLLAGIRLDGGGTITWFDEASDIDSPGIRERIGYTGPGHYYLPGWTVKNVREISSLLFERFDPKRFDDWCTKLAIDTRDEKRGSGGMQVSKLSDGNRMKLMLAGVLSRKTDLLLLDEPASPLDPLMRDTLCDLILDYLASGDGRRSVFFSTHNISDMERVTDYAIILHGGKIIESGAVEDLKEKYIMVRGDNDTADAAAPFLQGFAKSAHGYEGLAKAADLDRFAGMGIAAETPTLFEISVAIMKTHSRLKV